MNPLLIKVPITRIDTEGHMVYGYASTGEIDTFNTIFDPAWWPQAIIGYLQKRTLSAMHLDVNGEPKKYTGREPGVVGSVPILEVDESGIWIGARVDDETEWEKVISEQYNGFSVSAMPFEWREEVVKGKTVVRYTKFHLDDITIGYPASCPGAQFQYVERLEYDDSSPWDWDWTRDANAIIDQLGWKGLKQACLYQDPDKDPETKAAYKFPVAKLKEGKLTIFWNGIRAAMARLLGAGNKPDLTDAERRTVYNKLKKLYKQFGKDVPEFRLDQGGEVMNNFTKKVAELIERLAGKKPDEEAVNEIQELEGRLADENAKKVTDLTETVEKLTERLDKLEKAPGGDEDPGEGDEGKDMEKLTESVKKVEERLDAVEKGIAKTQQPGEDGNEVETRTDKEETVFDGVVFPY